MSPESPVRTLFNSATKIWVGALLAVVLVVGAIVAGVFVTRSVAASQLEARISKSVRPPTPGLPAPAVVIGGYPLFSSPSSDSFPSVTIRVEGVNRPEVGPVTVIATTSRVTIPHDFDDTLDLAPSTDSPAQDLPATAATSRVTVLITGDALGRALDLDNVVLGNERDSSLAGGTEQRARITGTIPGTKTQISAIVQLRASAEGAQLVPLKAATGPAGISKQDQGLALRGTAWTLPEDLLPLGAKISTLSVRGGTIIAEGSRVGDRLPLAEVAAPVSDW